MLGRLRWAAGVSHNITSASRGSIVFGKVTPGARGDGMSEGGRHEIMGGLTIRQHHVVGDFMGRYGGVFCGGGMVHNGGD